MWKKTLTLFFLITCGTLCLQAQIDQLNELGTPLSEDEGELEDEAGNRLKWGGRANEDDDDKDDEESEYPIGQFQWRVEPRLGTIIDAENNDTIVHNFQNFNLTEGYTSQYAMLGNLGSPRLSRLYLNRPGISNFFFLDPLDFFRSSLEEFRFTNTLSPITNLAYHKCGTQQSGEDRIRAYFATNINKLSGIGFKLDYLYGRGYYTSSSTSMFGSTFYGYYRGDIYNVHAYVNVNHMKESENGGIEDNAYIENPQSFPQKYSSSEIPVLLTNTWNRNHEQTFYLTQKVNAGIWRDIEVPDSLKPVPPSDGELFMQLPDSVRLIFMQDSVAKAVAIDSLKRKWENEQVTPREFIPVTSFIHTFELNRLTHSYIAKETPSNYYTNHYYGAWNNVHDDTKGLNLRNSLGVQLREGFSKWAQSGLAAFITHKLRTYNLPTFENGILGSNKWTENDLSLGGVLSRTQGKLIHYNFDGELWFVGENAGDFKVDGHLNANIKTGSEKQDSIFADVHALLHHETPGFYLRHYHSQATWWDNTTLDRQLKTRIEGKIDVSKTKTHLSAGVENVTNYTYFAMQNALLGNDPTSTKPKDYSRDVIVQQESGNVQVFSATLNQELALGPIHWDNEISYQTSSNKDVLPLPDLNIYSNLYALFHVAKVLRVQLGGDVRYFTSYYAPDFAPSIQQFAVQDVRFGREKVGNYPIVNVYLNMHLKHCRIYLAMNHVNQGSGHAFWSPHYPVNPRSFHFGVSWNFFN